MCWSYVCIMQLLEWTLRWMLGFGTAIASTGDIADFERDKILGEIERLREEVQRLKAVQSPETGASVLSPQGGMPVQADMQAQRGLPQQRAWQGSPLHNVDTRQQPRFQQSSSGMQPLPQAGGSPRMQQGLERVQEPELDVQSAQREIANIRDSLGQLSNGNLPPQGIPGASYGTGGSTMSRAAAGPSDGCMKDPLFAALHGALQKLALLEQDPVEASYQIHAAWERDPALFDVCPAGLITALVYLSMAQDQEWKYRLLHRATYFLYSTPGLAAKMVAGRWPMSDRLIRTMYHNSEVRDRTPLRLDSTESQPRDLGWASRAADLGVDEAVGLSMQHRDSVRVHFSSVLFYHFYHADRSPCACRTRSWCLPHWMRYLTNHTVGVWLAARDERKTLYRMDRSGCLRSLGHGLGTHHFAESFDLVFVFEINAFMHPQCRIIPARRMLLYPTFELSDAQMNNFEDLGVSVLPDDALLKPPNAAMRQLLEDARDARQVQLQRPKDRLLIFPADIRPMKGQTDFLAGLLFAEAQRPSSIQRLRGLTIVVAGSCDGNETYCSEVVSLSERVNADGILNVVIADQLKDQELAQLYSAALGVVLHSRVDCNPRAIYEGLIADAPFFVTERTRVPPLVQHLGHVFDGGMAGLPEQLADFVDFCEARGFAGRPRAFAERHLVEADVYREAVKWMELKYMTGKALEPIIRSEDALAGPLAGLGSLLGGAATGLGGAPMQAGSSDVLR